MLEVVADLANKFNKKGRAASNFFGFMEVMLVTQPNIADLLRNQLTANQLDEIEVILKIPLSVQVRGQIVV